MGHKNSHKAALTASIFKRYNHNCTAPIETGTTNQRTEPQKRKSKVFLEKSVIKTEKTQTIKSWDKIEQIREQPAAAESAEFEAQKADVVMPEKTAPTVKQSRPEIAPSKPQSKKKEAVEPRATRLRRAEKILTGI